MEEITPEDLPPEDEFDPFWPRMMNRIASVAWEDDMEVSWEPGNEITISMINKEDSEDDRISGISLRREGDLIVIEDLISRPIKVSAIPQAVWAVLYHA